jgi:hypothetical protein
VFATDTGGTAPSSDVTCVTSLRFPPQVLIGEPVVLAGRRDGRRSLAVLLVNARVRGQNLPRPGISGASRPRGMPILAMHSQNAWS